MIRNLRLSLGLLSSSFAVSLAGFAAFDGSGIKGVQIRAQLPAFKPFRQPGSDADVNAEPEWNPISLWDHVADLTQ